MKKKKFLTGRQILPEQITAETSLSELVDGSFLAYNAARLREACHLYVRKMLEPDVTVGVSLTGALTPAGLGMSSLIPLIEQGFIDWIISTGANLYHDAHFAIGHNLHVGSPFIDDRALRKEGVIRIYDVLFEYDVLLSTDEFFRTVIKGPEFQKGMATSEFHYLLGKYLSEREKALGIGKVSLLSAAYAAAVPIYSPSPGDSSIGMNIAREALVGNKLQIDISRDINETAAIVLNAKRKGKSAVWILGGGSPKNFLLQTEPHIQEILGIEDAGHDYFLQITDARPDTGGLSGATPSEAVSWGKVDPNMLPDAVVCYSDVSIALPVITAYALANHEPRERSRLYEKREALHEQLLSEFKRTQTGLQ
ncbi:MAG: deoxyhypusine synthase [Nitrospirota bacterium]|nr:MAG: deoxyhypusine synthase [Nitrospirota bacterium]